MSLNINYTGTPDEVLRQDGDVSTFVTLSGQEIENSILGADNSILALKALVATQGKMIHLLQKEIEELKNGSI